MHMDNIEDPLPEADRNTMRISNRSIRQEGDTVNRENSPTYPDHYDSMDDAPALNNPPKNGVLVNDRHCRTGAGCAIVQYIPCIYGRIGGKRLWD